MAFFPWRSFANPQARRISLALIAVLLTFINPMLPLRKRTYDFLFVIDITQSMNTRDYKILGMPTDRLSFVKQALRGTLLDLPCGSNIGVGVFSNKEPLLLVDSIELCENFSVLDAIIAHIDWRMAWAADSNIRRGLYKSLLRASRLPAKPSLVFLSDGEATTMDSRPAPLGRFAGSVHGAVIGVGGRIPTPIPKLDQQNTLMGYWKAEEITLFKTKSIRAENEDGYYLSTVDESNLKNLATLSRLHYRRLDTANDLLQILLTDDFAIEKQVNTDIRWVFALIGIGLLLLNYPWVSNRPAGKGIINRISLFSFGRNHKSSSAGSRHKPHEI